MASDAALTPWGGLAGGFHTAYVCADDAAG